MTQQYLGQITDTTQESGDDLAARLNAFDSAHKTNQSGTNRPGGIQAGGIWSRDLGSGVYALMLYDGSGDRLIGFSGLSPAANRLPYFTGATSMALTTLTAFGRSLIDDADAEAALNTLGATAAARAAFQGNGAPVASSGDFNALQDPGDYTVSGTWANGPTGTGTYLGVLNVKRLAFGGAGGGNAHTLYLDGGEVWIRYGAGAPVAWGPWQKVALGEQGIGIGQTWQDMTSQRSSSTWYQNTTGRTISWSGMIGSTANTNLYVSDDGVTGKTMYSHGGMQGRAQYFLLVGPGEYYSATNFNGTWWELR